jgi:hypothetical protein
MSKQFKKGLVPWSGLNNEMHSGGYQLTKTYRPCNGGSHRTWCRKETSSSFQPECFFVANFCHLGTGKKGLMNLPKRILGIKKKYRHILRRKSYNKSPDLDSVLLEKTLLPTKEKQKEKKQEGKKKSYNKDNASLEVNI